MSFKRIAAALTAAALLISLAVGCADKKDYSSGATLRTMTILGDSANAETYSSLLCEFTKAHDDIYLQDTTAVEADAFKLGATLFDTYESGSAPHVVYYYNNTGMDELSQFFVPVDEIRGDYPDFAGGLSDSVLKSLAASDGHTYCMPVVGRCAALAANKAYVGSAFDEGVSWESFMDAVRSSAAQNIVPVADCPDCCADIMRWLISCCGGSKACTAGLEGDKDALEQHWTPALEQYASLCEAHAFLPAKYTDEIAEYVSPSDVVDYVGLTGIDYPASDVLGLFTSGRAAMTFITNEKASILDADSTVILPLPVPKGGDGDTCVLGCFDRGFYITRKAYSNPVLRDIAVSFVDYMISADASAAFAGEGFIPANDGAEITDPMLAQMMDAVRSADNCILFPGDLGTKQQWGIVERYAAQLYYGIITPEQMIRLLADRDLATSDIVTPPDTSVTPSDAPGI